DSAPPGWRLGKPDGRRPCGQQPCIGTGRADSFRLRSRERDEVLAHHGGRPVGNDHLAPGGLLTTGFPLSGGSHFSPPSGGSAFTGEQSAVRASSESNQTRSNLFIPGGRQKESNRECK